MAWSGADIPAAELAAFAANKPFILTNAITRAAAITWTDNVNSTAVENTSFPSAYAFDGQTDLQAQPTDTGSAAYCLRLDLGSEKEFDTVAIVRHGNLNGIAVRVDVADNLAFTTNLYGVMNTTVNTTGRFMLGGLSTSTSTVDQVITARYVRIRFASVVPTVYEVFIGKRAQFLHNPDVPWDPDGGIIDAATAISVAGKRVNYVRHGIKRVLEGEVTVTPNTYAQGLLDAWEGTNGHALPVLLSLKPTAAKNEFLMGFMQDAFSLPYAGPFDRRYGFTFEEQGPHFLSAEA